MRLLTKFFAWTEQHLLAPVYEHDDGRGQLRPDLLATMRTLLRNDGVHPCGRTTHTAVLRVLVPVEQFATFPRLQIEFCRQMIERLAQWACLVAIVLGDGIVDAGRPHLRPVLHRCYLHHVRPGLQFDGRILSHGDGTTAVRVLLQHDGILDEYEPIFHDVRDLVVLSEDFSL